MQVGNGTVRDGKIFWFHVPFVSYESISGSCSLQLREIPSPWPLMLMNTWSILKTIKVRMHCKHIRKPETNYPCCLWLNFPDWFLPHNVIMFSQKFWCSLFSEFMCCLKCFPLKCTFWCFMITKCLLITFLLKLSDLQNVDLLWTYADEHDRVNEGQTHWSDIDVFYICYGKGT